MSDYYATLRVQHGRMRTAMVEMGISSLKELSAVSGASYQSVINLFNFTISPQKKNGTWRDPVIKICKALCYEPNDLFPVYMRHEVPTNKIHRFVEHAQLASGIEGQLQLGNRSYLSHDESAILNDVIGKLTPIEQSVLTLRFGLGGNDSMTLDDVAKNISRTHDRVRQIEAKALRKMRKPYNMKMMERITDWG